MNVKALERGNKLWEGHRVILPEHEEQLWRDRKKKEEYHPNDRTKIKLSHFLLVDATASFLFHYGSKDNRRIVAEKSNI